MKGGGVSEGNRVASRSSTGCSEVRRAGARAEVNRFLRSDIFSLPEREKIFFIDSSWVFASSSINDKSGGRLNKDGPSDGRLGVADRAAGGWLATDGLDSRVSGAGGRPGADGRIGGVDGRIGGVDGRIGGVDGRIGGADGLESRIGGADGLESRIGGADGRRGGADDLAGGGLVLVKGGRLGIGPAGGRLGCTDPAGRLGRPADGASDGCPAAGGRLGLTTVCGSAGSPRGGSGGTLEALDVSSRGMSEDRSWSAA